MQKFIRALFLVCTLPAVACDEAEFNPQPDPPGITDDDAEDADELDADLEAPEFNPQPDPPGIDDEDDEDAEDEEAEDASDVHPDAARKAPDPRQQPDPPGFNPQPDPPRA